MSMLAGMMLTSCIIWIGTALFLYFGIRHLENSQKDADVKSQAKS